MKHFWLIFIFILSFSSIVYAQMPDARDVLVYIERCNQYLGNSVPNNFTQLDDTTFRNEARDILLHTRDNVVYLSRFSLLFDRTRNANIFYDMVVDVLETTGWEFYHSFDNFDVYLRNGIGVMVLPVGRRRNDNVLIVDVWFIKENNFRNFFNYPNP